MIFFSGCLYDISAMLLFEVCEIEIIFFKYSNIDHHHTSEAHILLTFEDDHFIYKNIKLAIYKPNVSIMFSCLLYIIVLMI